jgi:predicted SnoaL-like aldol condensation-catalyzing enzyme
VSEENNRAIVRRYFEEVWNRGDLAAADLLVAPNFSLEGCGGAISGLEAVKLYVTSYRALHPSVHFTILSLLAEGDMVAACWAVSGMQTAQCGADEATAHVQKCYTTGLSVYRIADGQIAEAWIGSDHTGISAARHLGITRDGELTT